MAPDKNYPNLLILLLAFLFTAPAIAQEGARSLPHHMTPEEVLRRDEIGRDFYPTMPPSAPVRQVAEFEHMQSVLVRYPFGIPMELIVEMSQDCGVLTVVMNQSQQNAVTGQYQSAGVNMDNVEFMHAPTDSYWTRDYGPWFVVNSSYDAGVCNFPYNRPRPNDDDIPIEVADYLNVQLYGMELIHTGGNYMCDGMGVAASTDLVIEENPDMTVAQIESKVQNYLGVHTYHMLPDPLGEYIEHIDCWGKFLDVDKVLIGRVPESDPRYDDFEYVADYFAQQTSSYGTPYQVFRVFTPGNYPYTPYTNSLILNKKVFVPLTGSTHDNQALQAYENAMPGYTITGVMYDEWENTDALHCRTKGIADIGMLYVRHIPLHGEVHQEDAFEVTAEIVPYSGQGLYGDSLFISYRVDGSSFTQAPLFHESGHTYSGAIPEQPVGSEVGYYLHAADSSGRSMDHPYIGAPDPHVFEVIYRIPDVTVWPDTLLYTEIGQMLEGQQAIVKNESDSGVYIHYINDQGWEPFFWWIEPWNLTFPHLLEPGDSLVLNVMVGVPLDHTAGFLQDTLFVETGVDTHSVLLRVDSTLISGTAGPAMDGLAGNLAIAPNPVRSWSDVSFTLYERTSVRFDVFSAGGKHMHSYDAGTMERGSHALSWKTVAGTAGLNSGVYFVRLMAGHDIVTAKVVVY